MNEPFYKQVQARYQLYFLNYMAPIDRLESIIEHGICCKNWVLKNITDDLGIAMKSAQDTRSTIAVPSTGRPLHDYVPLYFAIFTPMICWNQHRNEDILYLQFSLDILKTPGAVITDGSALSLTKTKFMPFTQIEDLDILDVQAIQTRTFGRWRAEIEEIRRKKQAECLIPDTISFTQVYNIAVFSEQVKKRCLEILKKSDTPKQVTVSSHFYVNPVASKKG